MTTATSVPTPAVASSNGSRSYLGVLLVLAVAAVALWRFTTAETDAAAPSALDTRPIAERITELEARVTVNRENPQAWRQLVLLYVARAAEIEDPTFYARGREAFERALAVAPTSFDVVVAGAALELAAHQFGPALEWARQAHEIRPQSPDAYAVLVDAEVETGHYTDALIHAGEWVALRPNLSALSRLSYLRELHGDPDGSILAMQQAVQAGAGSLGDRSTVSAYLGEQYWAIGDLDRAEAAYRSSLADVPGNLLGEVGLARVLTARGEAETALERLQEIATTVPAPNITEMMGEIQLLLGRPEEAAASFALMDERYQLFEASGANAQLELAVHEASYGDAVAAIDYARAAHEARNTVLTADALGWALTRAGRADEAIAYVDEALRLGTQYPTMHLHAAFAYAAIGDTTRARAELRTSLDLNPAVLPGLWTEVDELAAQLGLPTPQHVTR